MSLSCLIALLVTSLAGIPKEPVHDFELRDLDGRPVRLSEFQHHDAVVIVFLGIQCPLTRLYADRIAELADDLSVRNVAFLAINSNWGDSPEDIARFAADHDFRFPVLLDGRAVIADEFGATRQLEVFVLDRERRVRYHGRIDDQFLPGVPHADPSRDDLRIALEEILAGQPVTIPETEVPGCYIQRPKRAAPEAKITYYRDIAPILRRCCVECHRAGQIGPFSLTSYADAAAWSETIVERIEDGTMPPWHADPQFGNFANQRRLSIQEKRRIQSWVAEGLPEGNPNEGPSALRFRDDWNIGKPDTIVVMPEPYSIPRSGIIENIAVELDPGFDKDVWVRGTEVRPGNRSVVHHCTVFIGPPGRKELVDAGAAGLCYFSDYVPGLMPTLLPDGMARRLPAGWHIYFSLHYVPNGTATTDQTCMGIVLAKDVRCEVQTFNILQTEFELRPYQAGQRVEQTWPITSDVLLLSMFPHMHLRGQSFRYEAHYPDGKIETLLDVPRYDFLWQHRYVLADPKLLPAGSVLKGIAHFDNSPNNQANPDPSATVRYGKLTTDEMFHGYFDVALLPVPIKSRSSQLMVLVALVATIGVWLRHSGQVVHT